MIMSNINTYDKFIKNTINEINKSKSNTDISKSFIDYYLNRDNEGIIFNNIKYRRELHVSILEFLAMLNDNRLKIKIIDSNNMKYDMDNGTKICMCFDKGTPVAICLTDKGNEIETFVKEEYRRRGIGTKMVKQLSHPETKYNSGLDGSVEFYKSLGLRPSAVEQAYQNELRYKS
jgi:GNAT superfamily N-acetyltransferase